MGGVGTADTADGKAESVGHGGQRRQGLAQQVLVGVAPQEPLTDDVVLGGDLKKVETVAETHDVIVDDMAVGEPDTAGIGMEILWVHRIREFRGFVNNPLARDSVTLKRGLRRPQVMVGVQASA